MQAQETFRKQVGAIFPRQSSAVLESAKHMSKHGRQGVCYVVMHLKRETLDQPWGITFSRLDGRLILGKVNHESSKPRIEWCHAVSARDYCLDPPTVLSPMLKGPAESYTHNLRLYTSGMATPSLIDQQLCPGDLLASVDGWDPLNFPDLMSFTNYMRKAKATTLVLLRDREAATAALIKWELAPHEMPKDMPLLVAHAASVSWQRILCPYPDGNSLHTDGTTVIRQVTPDVHNCNDDTGTTLFGNPRVLFGEPPPPCFTSGHMVNSADMISNPKAAPSLPPEWRNSWFKTETGTLLPFEDNWEFSPEDGERAHHFLPPIDDFRSWLNNRKAQWRPKYKIFKCDLDDPELANHGTNDVELDERNIACDFWSPQGFSSFDDWLSVSTAKWKLAYSWNRKKRQRIQKECEAVAHISESMSQFATWLRVRRNQWRLLRRKRQLGQLYETPGVTAKNDSLTGSCKAGEQGQNEPHSRKRTRMLTPEITDIIAIDAIIKKEKEDRKRKESEKEKLVDISFLFFAPCGAPDDLVVHCLSFLEPTEYGKLLCINKTYSDALKSRDEVWRLLCPHHWILPRRPRKPWHELYFHRLAIEYRNSQKRWDDLLLKCSNELFKGDHLQKVEKLVSEAEKDFGFTVNYVSPVVCERNSLLNLAVIYRRHKVVRWLVDQKCADIESYDRGHFTALLNAAWAGDRQLVRYLMQRGADRSKIGLNHYTKGLAHPDFMGLTAEGWARTRGHDDIAELIRLGL